MGQCLKCGKGAEEGKPKGMYLLRGGYFTKEFQPHTEGEKYVKQDFMKKKLSHIRWIGKGSVAKGLLKSHYKKLDKRNIGFG